MKQRKIKPGTLADMLLMFISSSGQVSKKSLHTPFKDKFSSRYYSRVYQSLLASGYIQEQQVNGRLEVRLSRNGVAKVRELHPEREITKLPAAKDYMKKRRMQMLAGTNTVLSAADIIVSGAAKPNLMDIRYNASTSLCAKIDRAVKRGVFYTSSELKQICKSEDGSSEYLYSSRLLGVIIINWHIIYVYNVGERLIEMYPKREAKTIRAIENALAGTPYIKDNIILETTKPCLVISNIKSMLVKLYRGQAYGKQPTQLSDSEKERMLRWKAVHASFDLFKLLFYPIYFVSSDAYGAEMMKIIKSLYSENPGTPFYDLAHELGCNIDGTCAHMAFDSNDGSLVIPMPVIELHELDVYIKELRTQKSKADIYAPRYYADVISRCFGTTINEYFDSTTFEAVPIYRYDDNGYPVGDTYMAGLLPISKTNAGDKP